MSKKERLKKIFKEVESLPESELQKVEVAIQACKVVQTLKKSEFKSE
nr:MAG: hypothetical protein [Bacteriophage sp.]